MSYLLIPAVVFILLCTVINALRRKPFMQKPLVSLFVFLGSSILLSATLTFSLHQAFKQPSSKLPAVASQNTAPARTPGVSTYQADKGTAGTVGQPVHASPAAEQAEPPDAEAKEQRDGLILLLSILLIAVFAIGLTVFLAVRAKNNERPPQPAGPLSPLREEPGKPRPVNRHHASESDPAKKVTFADVAGQEEAKVELRDIVDFLKDPKEHELFGDEGFKGVLLFGPPGNGKTLLARAVAGEAGVEFFACSGSDFVEMYVGVGASRVRDKFKAARRAGRAIIFIDEIDAVGKRRSSSAGSSGNNEYDQTLNAMLVEMDGFGRDSGIVVIGATNRIDTLDPALIRPGRFDLQILVDNPDVNAREELFKVHTRNKPVAAEVNFRLLAERTPGYSGAEIAGACAQAAKVARRKWKNAVELLNQQFEGDKNVSAIIKGLSILKSLPSRVVKPQPQGDPERGAAKVASPADSSLREAIEKLPRQITMPDFDEGVDRVKLGLALPSRGHVMSREELTNTAVHELGHAAVSHEIGEPVTKITIVSRARALGYVQATPQGDRFSTTDKHLKARIAMALAGRLSQVMILCTVDTGASNDFEQAEGLARRMVTEWGMSQNVGLRCLSPSSGAPMPGFGTGLAPASMGLKLADRVDEEIEKILLDCKLQADQILKDNRKRIEYILPILLKKETLLGPEWLALWEEAGKSTEALPPEGPGTTGGAS